MILIIVLLHLSFWSTFPPRFLFDLNLPLWNWILHLIYHDPGLATLAIIGHFLAFYVFDKAKHYLNDVLEIFCGFSGVIIKVHVISRMDSAVLSLKILIFGMHFLFGFEFDRWTLVFLIISSRVHDQPWSVINSQGEITNLVKNPQFMKTKDSKRMCGILQQSVILNT